LISLNKDENYLKYLDPSKNLFIDSQQSTLDESIIVNELESDDSNSSGSFISTDS
jgi:hypothetical protein